MRMEEAFYNISMYLYNKNILEYAQIARSGSKSMILTIESSSNILFPRFLMTNYDTSFLDITYF